MTQGIDIAPALDAMLAGGMLARPDFESQPWKAAADSATEVLRDDIDAYCMSVQQAERNG